MRGVALARIIESNFHIILPRCLAFITARLLCWVQFCGIVMCEPQPEQWKNDAVCASCVYVGLLPGCGTIWSGVRICDKLQIYLGGAHWCIPLPLLQNAQCWLGCQMLTWVAGFGKIKRHAAQNHQQKDFLFLASSVVMVAQHDLKRRLGSVVLMTLQKQLSVLSQQS